MSASTFMDALPLWLLGAVAGRHHAVILLGTRQARHLSTHERTQVATRLDRVDDLMFARSTFIAACLP